MKYVSSTIFADQSLTAAFHVNVDPLSKSVPLPLLSVSRQMLMAVILLVFVIIEYLAYTWYTLSYIPYARAAVLKVFGMA